jgi:hypothetical protein
MQTALRAVSVRGVLTPLAVLVPILATVLGAAAAFILFPPLALLVIAVGLVVTGFAGRTTYGARVSVAAGGCTLLALPIAFVIWLWAGIDSSLCGKDVGSVWIALAATLGVLVFLGTGSFGLRTYRALAIMPLAFLAAVITMLLVVGVAPGSHSFCET